MKSVFEKLITLCIFIICLIASGCSHTSSSPEGQSPLSGTRQTEVVLDSPAFTSQRLSSAEIVSEADCSIEFITEVNQFGNLTSEAEVLSDGTINLTVIQLDKGELGLGTYHYRMNLNFILEYQFDNEWFAVPDDHTDDLQKGSLQITPISQEYRIMLPWIYKTLPAGHYRLIEQIEEFNPYLENLTVDTFYIATEFDYPYQF